MNINQLNKREIKKEWQKIYSRFFEDIVELEKKANKSKIKLGMRTEDGRSISAKFKLEINES